MAIQLKPYRIAFGVEPVAPRPEGEERWSWEGRCVRALVAIVAGARHDSLAYQLLVVDRTRELKPVRVGVEGGAFRLMAIVPLDSTPEGLLDGFDTFFRPHGWRVVR